MRSREKKIFWCKQFAFCTLALSLISSPVVGNPLWFPFTLWSHPQWITKIFPQLLPPNPSHYPSFQHQQIFPGNIAAKQTRETGKPTEISFHSSKSSSSVSSLALWQTTCWNLLFLPVYISYGYHRTSPPNLLPANLLLISVLNSNRHSLLAYRPYVPENQLGCSQIFTLPPLLHIQSPSLIPSSAVEHHGSLSCLSAPICYGIIFLNTCFSLPLMIFRGVICS